MKQLTVMLVDDELLVRLGIKSLIDWNQHGFEYIGDSADGESALELMAHRVPDILLTDIVMPKMNGLELIECVKKRYPDTLIIVLSSHNEYDYVRRAMKLGVEDYLLKASLKPADLLEMLVEASDKIARVQHSRAILATEPDEAAVRRRVFSEHLRHWLPSDSHNRSRGEAANERTAPQLNHYLLLLHMRRIRDGVSEQSAAGLLKHLIQSEMGKRLSSNPEAVGKREIAVLLEPDDDAEIERAVNDLSASSQQLLGIALSIEAAGPLSDWRQVREQYERMREKRRLEEAQETPRSDIKRLLDYLSSHYTEDISLKTAAAMINMSESYLSTVFKKETGTGFTDWMNALRIERAAGFLAETDWPAYLIAERVGYENVNYFGRLFKKIKGVSPQQYRSRRQKKET